MSDIAFRPVMTSDLDTVSCWLSAKHVVEFWDTSSEHKRDIDIFASGRKEASSYFEGRFHYWLALIEQVPFAMIMTIQEMLNEERPHIKTAYLSNTGNTYSLDFMIGNIDYLGKGLAAQTLDQFVNFFSSEVDTKADTYFIDPTATNVKAKTVYKKAGFKLVGSFKKEESMHSIDNIMHFLVKKV